MESLHELEDRWRSVSRNDADPHKRLDEQCAFLEEHVVEHPRQVMRWAEELYGDALEAGYKQGLAYAKGMQGYALYMLSDHSKALPLLHEALAVVENTSNETVEARIAGTIAGVHISLGNFKQALDYGYRALLLIQQSGDRIHEGWTVHGFGTGFFDMGAIDQALTYFEQSLVIFEAEDVPVGRARALTGIGSVLQEKHKFREALPYHEESLVLFKSAGNSIGEARALNDIGCIQLQLGNPEQAYRLHSESLKIRKEIGNRQSQSTSLMNLGNVCLTQGSLDEAITHYQTALDIAEDIQAKPRQYQIHELLAKAYEQKNDLKQALSHIKTYQQLKEAVLSDRMELRLNTMQAEFETEKAEQQAELERIKNVELSEKNETLETLLAELRATQAQLIQTEKLASLGQLTAGIAHEIKNPLNFVNNFAELSLELLDEIRAILPQVNGQSDSEWNDQVTQLFADLAFNTAKVHEHGQRADNIVRGMLEHAGGRSGLRQTVSINDLLKEYTRLAYHGYRTSTAALDIHIEEQYQADLPTIEAKPHDLGRVFLNMLNNAFYAVHKKQITSSPNYRPTVHVSTAFDTARNRVVSIIEDNGQGIPDVAQPKIFEPFFTTKPPGEGTGLGLSLSYDIVTQGHGGSIEVKTQEGTGTRFTIMLPID